MVLGGKRWYFLVKVTYLLAIFAILNTQYQKTRWVVKGGILTNNTSTTHPINYSTIHCKPGGKRWYFMKPLT